LARLGAEAEDGINAMLSQALSYERSNVPSLTGFIVWMQTDDLEIKRQIDSASDQIRVMTVHGAKGLEAPIVILPDTGRRDITVKDEIVRMEGVPIWKAAAADMPAPLRETIDRMKDAQFQERLRLLYVAMTRAEKWLIVAAAGDLSNDGSSWYQIAQAAMGHANAVPVGDDGTLRFAEGDWDSLDTVDHVTDLEENTELDPVFATPAPIYSLKQGALSPSDLGGAKALPGDAGEDKERAMLYGTVVHNMLERLALPRKWFRQTLRKWQNRPIKRLCKF
jgi:ATP-dependent helicase/nuclease subunit A